MTSLTLPAHVTEPLPTHGKLAIVKLFWIESALVSRRALQDIIGSLNDLNPVCTHAVVRFLPSYNGMRRTVEPTRTPMAPVLRIFVRGQRTICNFCRPHVAAGKPSFFNTLLKFCQEPFCSVFHRLFVAPAFLSVPAVHGQTMQRKDARSHEQCTREYE